MLKKYKQFMIGFLVGALVFSLSPVFAEGELNIMENPFPIFINGKMERVEGYNINGYTFLKLADFGKAGLVVKFNEATKRIEIESSVNVLNKIEKDGYELLIIAETEYVNTEDINKRYNGKLNFEQTNVNTLTIINNDTKLAIAEIPTKFIIKIDGKTYVDFIYIVRYLPVR